VNQRVGIETFAEAAELLALSGTGQPRVQTLQSRQSPPPNVHVEVRRVGKVYRSGGQRVEALRNIDLNIRRGEIFGIIGRSGAGKSSLIRTLNRLEEVSEGQVLIDGTDIGVLTRDALAKQRRKIGMIFQHFNLLNSKTVLKNLALPMKAAGEKDASVIQGRARDLLQLVGLEEKENVYPSRLSGGQKQRVAIARALMTNPEILLCDEATSALDPETTHAILELLADIRQKLGITVILITHEMAVISEICDRVAVMHEGQVVELGAVARVFRQPRHDATRALLAPIKRMIQRAEVFGHESTDG